jgi:hypothetical protein
MRARFHCQLGRLLLRRGELEEALSHARHGQSLTLAHVDSCPRKEAARRIVPIWDLCGDVLEEMGRLEEARESDHDAARRSSGLGVSGRRRLIQHYARLGDHEVCASTYVLLDANYHKFSSQILGRSMTKGGPSPPIDVFHMPCVRLP